MTAVLVCLALALPALADRAAGDPAGADAAWLSPAVDHAALLAEDEARRLEGIRPERGGLPLDVDLDPGSAGAWSTAPDGSRRWRLTVRTAGALWTILGFDLFRLPPGAELRVYDPAQRTVEGPFTETDARDGGELWLPPIEGDTLIVELDWPAERADEPPALHLGTVTHGYRVWGGLGRADSFEGSDCQIDVACPLGDAWQNQRRGVARLLIGNTGVFCTGSLVNNTAHDCAPYVLTANHCFSGGGNPASTTYLFNYALPACEPGSVPDNEQKITGSTGLANYVPSDYRLVQLSSSPPASWNLFWNGWSRSGTPATESWTLHHPLADLMKITHDADPLVQGIDQGPDHWRVENWEEGSTDQGSSGGPLFDQDQRIVGQLHVGTASCGNPGGFAEYGKLGVSWNFGLAGFLDPAPSTGATMLDGIDQAFCGAPEPRLSHASHLVDDSAGFVNGRADPGESFALQVALLNDGPIGATGVSGTLSTAHPLATVSADSATWGDIAPYRTVGSNAPHFTLDVGATFTCGESIPLQLSVTASEGSWQTDFLVPTGLAVGLESPPPFADDMESGTNGWTVQNLIGSSPWSQVTDQSNSPVTSWHVPNVSGVRDSVLVMPAISTMPPQATLRFAHLMISESGDGGVLEYTTDGSTWLDAGGWITTGPYNSVIPTGFGSPIGGRTAWAGDLGGWRNVELDLSALEGEQVTLRWRFASDTFSGNVGWYIDDVVLDTPVFQCATCNDMDNDGFCPAPDGDDCDDGNDSVYPGAPQICDGVNNDCDDASWPAPPFNEVDGDADGVTTCAGDCNGADPAVAPAAAELCDGRDNDCDGLVDNDAACDLSCDAAEQAGGDLLVTGDPSTSDDAALVWTGAGYGVVWSDARDGNLELYYSGLDPFGQVTVGEVRLTIANFDSVSPSLVWTGAEHAVTWCDDRNGPTEAYFARFDASGTKLTADVPLGSCLNTQTALVWSGSEYGAAWVDAAGEVRFVRLGAGGTVAGADVQLSDGSGTARSPSVVWNGADYAVAWHAKDGGNVHQIYFTRVDTAGAEIGNETAVTSSLVNSRRPWLAWTGSGYGVAWAESGGSARFIDFALLDAAGGVSAGPTRISDLQTGSLGPSVAWSGEEFGVAWRDTRDGNGEVYFSRVDAGGGEIGSELRLSDSPADSDPGPLAWTGGEYAIVWSETPEIHFLRLGCNCFDTDADGLSSCNDNCDLVFNPSQSDRDGDFEGDHCDLDDGEIYIMFTTEPQQVDWQVEQGYDAWNYYKGDLDELLASQLYTQAPGSNALAARQCGLGTPFAADDTPPAPGKTAFFLVAGVSGGVEDGLGQDSSGTPRPNDNPCP